MDGGVGGDLRWFVGALERAGELARVRVEVDPYLEIAEITDRVSKSEGGGPALLFERVRGSAMKVLTNHVGSERRMAMALRVRSLDELGDRIAALTELQPPGPGLSAKVEALRTVAPARHFGVRAVARGACQEVVLTGDDVDLGRLPILTTWPQDGGPYVTLPLVVTKDAHGRRNVGMYRVQRFDERTTGMHWQIHKDAATDAEEMQRRRQRIPVAVVIGADPAITYAATAPLPKVFDEFAFAGFLRGDRVDLVRCVTQPSLEVPAHAEIVLEGYVDPAERRTEGPFGDHTGWYSLDGPFPVFHVTAITHRRDALYAATVVGKPPMEDAWLGKATERLFLPLLKTTLPEVVDYDLPIEGVFHGCCIVSIRKRFPGHARKVMYGVWSTMLMSLTKCVIVVDADVDVHDYRQVAWRVFGSVDPKRDIEIVEGALDQLDHAAGRESYGGKIGIDATSKNAGDGFTRRWPDPVTMDPAVVARVSARWREYGLPAELGRPVPW